MRFEILDDNGTFRFESTAAALCGVLAEHPGWSARALAADLAQLASSTNHAIFVPLKIYTAIDALYAFPSPTRHH